MKVLMAFPFDFPGLSHWEGARTRLLSLSKGLLERGHNVHILSKLDSEYSDNHYQGIALHSYKWEKSGSTSGRYLSSILIGREIQRLDQEMGFDLVHLHLPIVAASAGLWKRLITAKTVYDTHDWYKLHDELYYNIKFLPRSFSGAVDVLEREICKVHNQVLVTTPLLTNLLGKNIQSSVVPNAVDTSHFRPTDSDFRERIFGKDSFVVGFLGVVSIYQGVWKLLEAAKLASREIPNLKLLVVGSGSVSDARKFAKSLDIEENVYFTGPNAIPYSELPGYISSMDLAVSPLQPLPRYQEYAQPLKVLEYMACDVPVVCTPLREQSRLITEARSGKIAKGFGTAELADAIVSLYNQRDDAVGKGSLRRYIVENYSMDAVLNDFEKAYGRLWQSASKKSL